MIAQNKYNDETIHVANWLLNSEIDLGELIAEARAAAKANNDNRDEATRTLLAVILKIAVPDEISHCINYDGLDYPYDGYRNMEAEYETGERWVLVAPMIEHALNRVSFEHLAELVLANASPKAEAA